MSLLFFIARSVLRGLVPIRGANSGIREYLAREDHIKHFGIAIMKLSAIYECVSRRNTVETRDKDANRKRSRESLDVTLLDADALSCIVRD